MNKICLFVFLPVLLCSGCTILHTTSKDRMQSGIYRVRNQDNRKYYVVVEEDSLMLHPVSKTRKGWYADTSEGPTIRLHTEYDRQHQTYTFVKRKLDVDLLSIPFKYRPTTSGFPQQLITNFNAAAYLGFGTDRYRLTYDRIPLNNYQRTTRHLGYSFGLFLGLGAPEITPSVTRQRIEEEYYGLVITKGATALINLGSLRFGVALGLDHLLDKNSKLWIYQGKPWAGLTVGLSLN